MPDLDEMTPGQILADSSVADFIKELGLSIAAAQVALDDNSVRQMDIFTARRDDLGGRSLLDLGLAPAFYHYQHADITCAMQIRMEVGKSDEFGFAIQGSLNDESSGQDSSSGSSETIRERALTKTAELTMRSDSTGALALQGGATITPTGSTPTERLADLQRRFATTDGDIERLVYRPPQTRPDISLQSATDRVVVDSPTVAFLNPTTNGALIRIRENADTNFVVSPALTVSTTAQGTLAEYAEHVASQFIDADYSKAVHIPPGARIQIGAFFHDTGVQEPLPASTNALEGWAAALIDADQPAEVEGFTDRQGTQQMNLALGEARANNIADALNRLGVPANRIRVASPATRGEQAAADAGDDDGQDNEDFRRTLLYALSLSDHWIFVRNGPNFSPDDVAPSAIGDLAGGPGNAYIHLSEPAALGLGSNGVDIDGEAFGFSGAAVTGGPAAGSAQAYAHNLAALINAGTTHRAWRQGSVVRVARSEDSFAIQLFTTKTSEVNIAESSNYTITEQFRQTTRSAESRDRNQSRTIAVGVSVDARVSRQYNLQVTGNSSISARLVAVPAPPEFLDQIQAYQNSLSP